MASPKSYSALRIFVDLLTRRTQKKSVRLHESVNEQSLAMTAYLICSFLRGRVGNYLQQQSDWEVDYTGVLYMGACSRGDEISG
jgi:hypothetical protein